MNRCALFFSITLALGAALCHAAVPPLQPTVTQTAPTIDGSLEDPCWQEQTWVSNFVDPETGQTAA